MTQPIHLPDCANRTFGPVLSARQRRELVRVLAQDGLKGMEEWIEKEAQNDPDIRARVEQEKDRIQRQARRERRHLEERFEEEEEQRRAAFEEELEERRERREALQDRMKKLTATPTAEELAERSELFKTVYAPDPDEVQPSLWDRVKNWVFRAWLWIVETWARFMAWILRRDRSEDAPTLDIAGDVELDLPGAMATNPGVRVRVKEKLRDKGTKERFKRWWRRFTGREDYGDLARELMAEELESAEETIEVERQEKKREIEEHLDEVTDEAAETRRERRRSLEELERRYEDRLEEVQSLFERGALQEVRETLLGELSESGLVTDEGTPTERLLEKFSSLLYEDVQRTLPQGGRTQPGAFLGGEGEYEKGPIRSLNERGALALVDSAVRAKQNHPGVGRLYDSDLLVHREVRSNTTHVVLIFDRSGSMEEKGRFEAAKKVCLIMHQAVLQADPRHRVDILSMATDVERVDLEGAWNAELGGFTNHGEALRQARELLEHEDADRRLVYLITDGLPEAYTDEEGEVIVDTPQVCTPYAIEQAQALRELPGVRVMMIQLETEEELYVDAARDIAEAAGGRVEALDPEQLTETIVMDFEAAMGEGGPHL